MDNIIVITNQNLAEVEIESFDMRREVHPVLEPELFSPARFGRARCREAVCRGIAQNGGAKLFVDQNPRLLFRDSTVDRSLKAVVDDLLRGRYFPGLHGRQRFMPTEHLDLE